MNLTQLNLLLALEREQFNLSRAAERLCIVQSAASRHLRQLEDEIGAPLLRRDGKRLKGWTHVGRQVVEQARQMEVIQCNLQRIAQSVSDPQRGRIIIGTTHTQAKYYLPDKLHLFRQYYPRVSLNIRQGHPQELACLLRAGEVDIAFCSDTLREVEGITSHFCYRWHYVLLTRRNHPLAQSQEVTLEQIARYPLLTYGSGFTSEEQIAQLLGKMNVKPEFALCAADPEVIKTYVREGFGVGIVAQHGYDPRQDADLVMHSLAGILPESETYVAWRTGLLLTEAQRMLVRLLAGRPIEVATVTSASRDETPR